MTTYIRKIAAAVYNSLRTHPPVSNTKHLKPLFEWSVLRTRFTGYDTIDVIEQLILPVKPW